MEDENLFILFDNGEYLLINPFEKKKSLKKMKIPN